MQKLRRASNETALEDLNNQGMERLIVDVRDNPGGLLTSVCDVLDSMLPEELLVYTEDKNGKKSEYNATGTDQFDKPMVILVNGNSASAAEIFPVRFRITKWQNW